MVIAGLNKDVLKRIIKELGIQSAVDKLPLEVKGDIQPVLISNPDRIIDTVRQGGASTTGSTTIFTTPATKTEFYLTWAQLRITSDATADNTLAVMTITPRGGAAVDILQILKQTTTAGSPDQTVFFNPPILLEPNTNIVITETFTVGASTRSGSIAGYTVDIL